MRDKTPGSRRRIAFATSSEFPDSTPDDRLVIDLLARRSVRVEPAVWDSKAVDWSQFGLVVLRSTWDYHRRWPEFLDWIDRTSAVTTVCNPPAVVRWNSHKGYLVDLASSGVDTVPTELVRKGSSAALRAILSIRGWKEVVVKPAVGANAHRLLRVDAGNAEAGESHLRAIVREGDALVQPFLEPATRLGERSFVFFDGAFSHALGHGFVLRDGEKEPTPFVPELAEVRRSRAILDRLPELPTYARLDFLPSWDGRWPLGELEVIEPDLFLRTDARAPENFARAILRRC